MKNSKELKIIRSDALKYTGRGGASDGVAEISWAIPEDGRAPLLAGFGKWHEADCEPKTLDYDEVLLVLEGKFGIELPDGCRIEGQAGDLFEIPEGTTVKYFGTNARLFFVTTPEKRK